MDRAPRRRWWLELALTVAAVATCVANLVWPTWAEQVVGIPPDGGSGELTTLVTLTALAVALTVLWSGHRSWSRRVTA